MDALTRDLDDGNANCRLWLSNAPSYRGFKTAALGRFACDNAAAGLRLLARAERELAAAGFAYLVGPMDGNTWHAYRLVTESDGSPPFFMEPANPDHYPRVFLDRGFDVIGDYASARADLSRFRPSDRYAKRLAGSGITLRPIDLARGEEELARIYGLALQTFKGNFLYTPISQDDFAALYRPALTRILPDYVLLAEGPGGDLEAFLFSVPNFAEGPTPTALIIKTYASRFPGLGGYLAEHIHQVARETGFTSVIHALMHLDNPSKRNSEKYGATFRRYALYGKALGR